MAMKKEHEVRVSCRSHKYVKEPKALSLAEKFDGGGHTEAAGFKISPNRFNSTFKLLPLSRFQINLDLTT